MQPARLFVLSCVCVCACVCVPPATALEVIVHIYCISKCCDGCYLYTRVLGIAPCLCVAFMLREFAVIIREVFLFSFNAY
jgi:hypothetical protein